MKADKHRKLKKWESNAEALCGIKMKARTIVRGMRREAICDSGLSRKSLTGKIILQVELESEKCRL